MNTNKTANWHNLRAQMNLKHLFFCLETEVFKTPEEELAFCRQKLLDSENLHELMYEVNGTYLAFIVFPDYLADSHLSQIWKTKIRQFKPTRFELLPFASYVLAHNRERIYGYRRRVKMLESRNNENNLIP